MIIDPKMNDRQVVSFRNQYLRCCRLRNMTPLKAVSSATMVLEFCADNIKYEEWLAIFDAISTDESLNSIAVTCENHDGIVLEHADCERLAKVVTRKPVIMTKFLLRKFLVAVGKCIAQTSALREIKLVGLPLSLPYLHFLAEAISTNNRIQYLFLPKCNIGNSGLANVCNVLCGLPNVTHLDVSVCGITWQGMHALAKLINFQKKYRCDESWKDNLQYQLPQIETMSGLRSINLSGNFEIRDHGLQMIIESLIDDSWIKAIDMNNCGLSSKSAEAVHHLLRVNQSLAFFNINGNGIPSHYLEEIKMLLKNQESGDSDKNIGMQLHFSSDSCPSILNAEQSVLPQLKQLIRNKNNKMKCGKRPLIITYQFTGILTKSDKEYIKTLHEKLEEEKSGRQDLETSVTKLLEKVGEQLKTDHRCPNNACVKSPTSVVERPSVDNSQSTQIEKNTLLYVQKAFTDIYTFVKNNKCEGYCCLSELSNKIKQQSCAGEPNRASSDQTFNMHKQPKQKKKHGHKRNGLKHNKVTRSDCIISVDEKENRKEALRQLVERNIGDSSSKQFVGGIDLLEMICSNKKMCDEKRTIERDILYSDDDSEESSI